MVTASMHLHQHADGHYALSVQTWEDGQGVRTLLSEESRPMPEVTMSEAWTVASQMAQDAIRAVEPSAGLWAATSWSRTS